MTHTIKDNIAQLIAKEQSGGAYKLFSGTKRLELDDVLEGLANPQTLQTLTSVVAVYEDSSVALRLYTIQGSQPPSLSVNAPGPLQRDLLLASTRHALPVGERLDETSFAIDLDALTDESVLAYLGRLRTVSSRPLYVQVTHTATAQTGLKAQYKAFSALPAQEMTLIGQPS